MCGSLSTAAKAPARYPSGRGRLARSRDHRPRRHRPPHRVTRSATREPATSPVSSAAAVIMAFAASRETASESSARTTTAGGGNPPEPCAIRPWKRNSASSSEADHTLCHDKTGSTLVMVGGSTPDMWHGFVDAYLAELDRIATAETPPPGKKNRKIRRDRTDSFSDRDYTKRGRTGNLARSNSLLLEYLDAPAARNGSRGTRRSADGRRTSSRRRQRG